MNHTAQPQIVRISNPGDRYLERTVFPEQPLLFETHPDALLEIHSFATISAIAADTIPCHTLQVSDELITSLLSRPS